MTAPVDRSVATSEAERLAAPSYAGLPPFAGLCSFDEATRSIWGVEHCVTRIKRHHYVLKRLHQILSAAITNEPIYELKTAFSLHAYYCAEHVAAYRKRVSEMREPPLGLELVPHPALEQACDEALAAPSTPALLIAVYELLLPALAASLDAYDAATNRLADAPTVRLNRFCRIELLDAIAFGRQAIARLVASNDRAEQADWLADVQRCLQASEETDPALPARRTSAAPFEYRRIPRRDERFHDSYNAGVNPEAFLYDERFSPRDKSLMMFYKRLREIDVPEMMAGIIVETAGKPWDYYRDMSRQLWDEARHAMLGEAGFLSQQIDWRQIPVNFTWSLNLNTQLSPQERHAVLFFIEQGLMPRTGKRYEWEVGAASGIPLARVIQDFDWADEVLHAQLGREWYVKDYGDLNAALAYGDKCWSKVLSHWQEYLDAGLTEHRNWWPELYRSACAAWNVPPDAAALAFDVSYASVRADLQPISASA